MRRLGTTISVVAALVISLIVLIGMNTHRPTSDQATATTTTAPPPATPVRSAQPPPWMHKLAPGEKPPQFVLFSFDGAGSHEHWQRVLPIARKANAHFSGFLSGIYLLPDSQRARYTGPGHQPGKASIGFGGSDGNVRDLVSDLNTALADGDEIGTHYNGHFCHGAEPSVGRWTTAQWDDELDQFRSFVSDKRRDGLRLDPAAVRGGRTPCLEGRFDQLFPALVAHGMNYDSSQPADGVRWPEPQNGVWEFWMPFLRVPALNHRMIMMDYNMWVNFNQGKEDPARSAEFTGWTLGTYRAAYDAAFAGNRAPLVIANHFNDWAGSAFSHATEQFIGEVCVKPETVCATYSEVIAWMGLQDAAVLDTYRKLPAAQT